MAKKTKKRHGRQQKDQSGCMWSLINIFDFRNGRSSQKLLLDKKRGSRRIDGAAYASIKLESLTDSCQICDESNDTVQSETSAIDSGKLSVKELMEEEMGGDQYNKKHGSISGENAEQSAADDGGYAKKNRRRMRSKMSLDLQADGFAAAGDLVAERPNHRRHKSCGSVDLNEMVEEMCSRIHQNSKHCVDCKHAVKPIGDSTVIEKKLGDATKVLVKHFTDVKSCTKDGKVQPSKELADALLFLNSNKELFLKLLQDPSSHLVKDIQSLQDIQVEEGKFKVLTGSQLLEQEIGNTKQLSSFWRRFKSQERNSSKKSDSSEDLSRIVVLKPGPPNSRISDTASACSSSPVSPRSIGDKAHGEKASSPFSFSEFKRRLKHAMRKEQHGTPHLSLAEQLHMANRDKKLGGETVPMASPSRDHFFIERIPKFAVGSKVEKTGKVKDGKTSVEAELAFTSEQRVSNIYVEARKHLAEIVGNSDENVNSGGRKVPKSLGRILSYSGYDSPTISSPKEKVEKISSVDRECHTGDAKSSEVMPEIDIHLPDQAKHESKSDPQVASYEPIHEDEVAVLEPQTLEDLPCHSATEAADITRSFAATSEKEGSLLEVSIEPCSAEPITNTDQDVFEESEESCPDSSTHDCSMNEKSEDLDVTSDAASRPSPISVLEPIFKEDDISPRGVKYFIGIEPIRPRQIKFEEETLAPLGRVSSIRICVDDDKYTFDFVKSVVQMSGLTWDELLKRSLFSDNLIDPSLIDEIDFLPDLLPLDFNLLFDIVNEVVIELCWLNFSCMLSLATEFVQPSLKRKDIFGEIWKRVKWYLKLDGPSRTLDQIVAVDFAKPGKWADLQFDCENIEIQLEEALLADLLEDTVFICFSGSLESESLVFPPVEKQKTEIIEL